MAAEGAAMSPITYETPDTTEVNLASGYYLSTSIVADTIMRTIELGVTTPLMRSRQTIFCTPVGY
jgi:hypothetical protein